MEPLWRNDTGIERPFSAVAGVSGPYKGRFFHVSPSDSGNEPSFAGIESAGQGSGQPWPMGSGW